jgi:putative two-component system response regulator
MRVWLVDDDEMNLFLAERIVMKACPSAVVRSFLDPGVALAAAVAAGSSDEDALGFPDMILVDYMMPGMDGHELIKAFRAMPESVGVPIVMLTAAGERSVRKRALDLGATDFMMKPLDPGEAGARIANLAAMRESQLLLRHRNFDLAAEVSAATRLIADREEELIVRLSRAAEFRDPETGSHIVRMAWFSRLIAERLGFSAERSDLLFRAAPMHDVGKLGVPDGILLKRGRLSDSEMTVMRRHSRIGHSILAGSSSTLISLGASIALTHHEKFDGTGYPEGLVGDLIPLEGRVVAIADVFDALTSVRPYKVAWEPERAAEHLRSGSGTHFDPECVEAFMGAWDAVVDVRSRFEDPPLSAEEEAGDL